MKDFIKKVYDNGMTLIYQHRDSNIVGAALGFRGGALFDGPNKGISHLMEHMWFNGESDAHRDEIKKMVSYEVDNFRAYTSHDYILTSFECDTNNFAKNFKEFARIVCNRHVNANKLEKEKQIVQNEAMERGGGHGVSHLDMVLKELSPEFFNRLYDSQNILGNKNTISRITAKTMDEFIAKRFTAENMIVSVVSDKSFEEVEAEFLKEVYNKVPSVPNSKITLPTHYPKQIKEQMQVIPQPMKSCAVSVIQNFGLNNKFNIDDQLLCHFEDILMNSFSGRFFDTAREEKKLCYSCGYMRETLNELNGVNLGMFVINSKSGKVNESLLVIANQIRELATNGVTKQEFERCKETLIQNLITKQIKFGRKNNTDNLLIFEVAGECDEYSFDKLIEKANALSYEDVNARLKHDFSSKEISVEVVGEVDYSKLISYDVFRSVAIPTLYTEEQKAKFPKTYAQGFTSDEKEALMINARLQNFNMLYAQLVGAYNELIVTKNKEKKQKVYRYILDVYDAIEKEVKTLKQAETVNFASSVLGLDKMLGGLQGMMLSSLAVMGADEMDGEDMGVQKSKKAKKIKINNDVVVIEAEEVGKKPKSKNDIVVEQQEEKVEDKKVVEKEEEKQG